jgi:hypothetical protein
MKSDWKKSKIKISKITPRKTSERLKNEFIFIPNKSVVPLTSDKIKPSIAFFVRYGIKRSKAVIKNINKTQSIR